MDPEQYEDQLVIPRLQAVVDGFRETHGHRPTAVIVPYANWRGSQRHPEYLVDWHNPIARELLPGLKLIPVPMQVYIAVDDEGRYCALDGGAGGGPVAVAASTAPVEEVSPGRMAHDPPPSDPE